jgi:hypothetical protein
MVSYEYNTEGRGLPAVWFSWLLTSTRRSEKYIHILKVHKYEKFFGSDFDICTFL